MAAVNITGFQRARRLAAAKAAKEAESNNAEISQNEGNGEENKQPDVNTPENETNATAEGNEPQNEGENVENSVDDNQVDEPTAANDGNDVTDFENMDIEDVKKQLDDLGVKYAHNTGEAKLREKLKDAING